MPRLHSNRDRPFHLGTLPAERLARCADAPERPATAFPGADCLEIKGVRVRFSRGRTARAESAAQGRPVALLDWFDAASATAAGFCASDELAAASR